MRTVISGFFCVILLIGALWLTWLGGTQFLAAQSSKSWPSVTGTITRSDFVYSGSGSNATRQPVVQYSYVVEGTEHKGARIAFGPVPGDKGGGSVFTTDRSKKIKEFATRIEGSDIAVYYDPAAPEMSVLMPGGGLFLLIYLFGAVLMLAVSAICFLLMTGRIRA